MTSRELAEKLNDDGRPYQAVTKEGRVVGFTRYEGDEEDGEGEEVSYSLDELGVDKGWLDEHPEGADRGGYCPFVFVGEASAFFHDEWQVAR